jgi:hypothetical protein
MNRRSPAVGPSTLLLPHRINAMFINYYLIDTITMVNERRQTRSQLTSSSEGGEDSDDERQSATV